MPGRSASELPREDFVGFDRPTQQPAKGVAGDARGRLRGDALLGLPCLRWCDLAEVLLLGDCSGEQVAGHEHVAVGPAVEAGGLSVFPLA